MARTNWGPIILGMGLLAGGIYVFVRWDEVCPSIMGAERCTGGIPGLFGGTITGSGIAQGWGQVHTDPVTGKKTIINTRAPVAGSQAVVTGSGSGTKKLQTSGSGSAKAGTSARANVKTTSSPRLQPKTTTKTSTSTKAVGTGTILKPCKPPLKRYPNSANPLACACPPGMMFRDGGCVAGAARYTNVNSFNTFTLNRVSVR